MSFAFIRAHTVFALQSNVSNGCVAARGDIFGRWPTGVTADAVRIPVANAKHTDRRPTYALYPSASELSPGASYLHRAEFLNMQSRRTRVMLDF